MMGAAAVPMIGQIVTSVVVGTVATRVAESMGMGSASGLIGTIAGVAAGGYVGGQMTPQSPAAQPKPEVGMDIAKATALPDSGPDLSVTPIEPDAASGADLYGGYSPTPEAGRGMLSQAAPPPKVDVAQQMIQQGVVPDDGASETPSFLERMFSPEKTIDMAMAAVGGMSDYTLAKEDREYPESVKRSDAREWDKQFGGSGQVGSSFSKYQRGS